MIILMRLIGSMDQNDVKNNFTAGMSTWLGQDTAPRPSFTVGPMRIHLESGLLS
ncbi:hypothetical protein BDV33DRAFT_163239 [Aspergillus novoparasiticus]|uniref:Uncharacterized protein n=1 Tax=Aspergillus novoparasiticus TaxID=986946 RepID=A0A5N6F9F1_9EURO|nr:hypothetical protein BDV33DRAFT_163239 [Aspergillus novoparasiticus]